MAFAYFDKLKGMVVSSNNVNQKVLDILLVPLPYDQALPSVLGQFSGLDKVSLNLKNSRQSDIFIALVLTGAVFSEN